MRKLHKCLAWPLLASFLSTCTCTWYASILRSGNVHLKLTAYCIQATVWMGYLDLLGQSCLLSYQRGRLITASGVSGRHWQRNGLLECDLGKPKSSMGPAWRGGGQALALALPFDGGGIR